MKHSAAYYERKAAEAKLNAVQKVDLSRLDAEYRRMLGVREGAPLPKDMGTTSPSSTGQGRRGRLVRKVRNKARNTTMKQAMRNVR